MVKRTRRPTFTTVAKVGPALRRAVKDARRASCMHGADLCLGKREGRRAEALAGVPGACRTQIGCGVIVPWCAWERRWQALQVIDYQASRTALIRRRFQVRSATFLRK